MVAVLRPHEPAAPVAANFIAHVRYSTVVLGTVQNVTENRMRKMLIIACLLAGTALLTGCPKKATTIQPPAAGAEVGGSANPSAGSDVASTSGSALGNNGAAGARGGGSGAAGVTRGIIYFD